MKHTDNHINDRIRFTETSKFQYIKRDNLFITTLEAMETTYAPNEIVICNPVTDVSCSFDFLHNIFDEKGSIIGWEYFSKEPTIFHGGVKVMDLSTNLLRVELKI